MRVRMRVGMRLGFSVLGCCIFLGRVPSPLVTPQKGLGWKHTRELLMKLSESRTVSIICPKIEFSAQVQIKTRSCLKRRMRSGSILLLLPTNSVKLHQTPNWFLMWRSLKAFLSLIPWYYWFTQLWFGENRFRSSVADDRLTRSYWIHLI